MTGDEEVEIRYVSGGGSGHHFKTYPASRIPAEVARLSASDYFDHVAIRAVRAEEWRLVA